jgi:hypothetical protein
MRAESDASKAIESQKGLTLHPQHSISTADLAIGARLESNPRNAPPKWAWHRQNLGIIS